MVTIDHRYRALLEEYHVATHQQKMMNQDLEDELAPKRHRAVAPETDTGMTEKGDDRQLQAASLLETAYGAALYSKSMSDKIMGRHVGLRLAKFRRDVLAYHTAASLEGGKLQLYCHITGW